MRTPLALSLQLCIKHVDMTNSLGRHRRVTINYLILRILKGAGGHITILGLWLVDQGQFLAYIASGQCPHSECVVLLSKTLHRACRSVGPYAGAHLVQHNGFFQTRLSSSDPRRVILNTQDVFEIDRMTS
jgi:hypothetical protein